jgi:hypothetical protein
MTETQKFMGKNQLIKRLAAQVGSEPAAIEILKKRGDLKADGKTLTDKGQKRNKMTAGQRAIDRASKKSGKAAKDYVYNPKTNTATLKD